ncbi:DUF6988 family protein [Sulfurospirillum cavolei]|uniref:DUF6988 family protein n=1 Tax=Sulfurospirillum cavolei TaxID=366522 RepID=UPI0005AB4ACF|nr:DUF5677 domain-containing protein [Sulfurospirillum cavolei]
MNKIEAYTVHNREFLEKLEAALTKIEISDSEQKKMLLAGFVRNALTHYKSINLLIENKLYNSAFALVRVLFEGVVRGCYMYHILDDEAISQMYTSQNWDNFFGMFGDMCQALDNHYGEDLFVKTKNTAYKMMNDYTHTGVNQIARNFNEVTGQVEADFSEDLICNTLEGNFDLFKIFSILLLEIGISQGNITKEELEEIFHFDLKQEVKK